MAANHRNAFVGRVGALELRDEARCTHDVERGDAEDALGVVDALGLEDFGDDGDRRVDLDFFFFFFIIIIRKETAREGENIYIYIYICTYRVGNDQNVGIRRSISSGLGEVTNNRGIGVEEVITSHAGLTGNTGGDEDNLGSLEGIAEAGSLGFVAVDRADRVDVAKVSSDTCDRQRGLITLNENMYLIYIYSPGPPLIS